MFFSISFAMNSFSVIFENLKDIDYLRKIFIFILMMIMRGGRQSRLWPQFEYGAQDSLGQGCFLPATSG